ncbi:MAG TPA: hypothetical protein VJZ50_04565, partial [Candidatus Limnocylindrales bacterium]|nr:hypothetical protein [Candidatus Limnocylindrales bacterium]
MRRSMLTLAAILPLTLTGLVGPAGTLAVDGNTVPTGSAEGLLAALARVPDSPAARQNVVSYLDQRAVAAARPGAARPGSIADVEALLA